MKELVLKKCTKCGALIKVIEDCNCSDCGITCCGEPMFKIKANSVDASHEKHVPTYERENNEIVVRVNHVMEMDHYIEWICLVTEEKEEYVYFSNTSKEAIAKFNDVKTGTLYSYCNKHGLWKEEI